MSTTVTPPPKKTNRIGLEVLNYKGAQDDALRRLRAQRHLGAHHRGFYETGRAAVARGQVLRHRLLVEIAGLFPEPGPRLQLRSRPRPGHRHRRAAGKPQPAGTDGDRRWRHGLDRPGPVRAHAAPECADDLHHREQRRLWPDEGPVLRHGRFRLQAQDRRGERSAADRLLPAGRSNWARPLSRARSPATSASFRRCSKPPSRTRGSPSST